jgi:hypothetical protein
VVNWVPMLEKNEPAQKMRKSRWRKGERLKRLFCGMSRGLKLRHHATPVTILQSERESIREVFR